MDYLNYKKELSPVEKNTQKLVSSLGAGERANFKAASIIRNACLGSEEDQKILKQYGLW